MPWTALPGVVQVLHVSGPEWVHMFEDIVATASNEGQAFARFGHLVRPSTTSSIALPQRALMPGSKTALVGTLMEVREVRRLSGGRLLIVAHAMSKFRVIRPSRCGGPFPRADVSILPDEEEVGLTGLRREAGLPTSPLPRHWRQEAARAAAAAASLAWAEAEIDSRSYLSSHGALADDPSASSSDIPAAPSTAADGAPDSAPDGESPGASAPPTPEASATPPGLDGHGEARDGREPSDSAYSGEELQRPSPVDPLTPQLHLGISFDGEGSDIGSRRTREELAPLNP